jgi:hypothetical protein
VTETAWATVLGRYAGRLHALAGGSQQVASPLGAWLIVALCSTVASGPEPVELERALGVAPGPAAAFAASLVRAPHPLVMSGTGVWNRPGPDEGLATWKASLPPAVATGAVPGQPDLDAWAERHTGGLITKFPAAVGSDVVLLMATALATKVSWARPFDLAPGTALGRSSPWSSRLAQVLQSPAGDPRHQQFIADTEHAGLVAVHIARARGGLLVASVEAAPDVAVAEVIAAAHDIATTEALDPGGVTRHTLFDLPLGDSDRWSIREESASTVGGRGEERCQAVLPAWSAVSNLDLDHAALGFPAVAATLASALGLGDYRYQARQAAAARYSRFGFEAAAVSALNVAAMAPLLQPGLRRVAELRFGHPFAVVAVTVDEDQSGQLAPQRTAWHGLPVFSAWVTDPIDAAEPAGDP